MPLIRIKRSVTDLIRGSMKTKHVKASKSMDETLSFSMVASQRIDSKTTGDREACEDSYLEALSDAYYEPGTLDIRRSLKYGLSSPLQLSAILLSPHTNAIVNATQSPSSKIKPILERLNTVKDLAVNSRTSFLPSTPVFGDSPNISDILASPYTPSLACSTPVLSSPASGASTASFIVSHSVRIEDFQMLEFLSKGSCGQVYLTKHKPSNKQLALKVIKKSEGVWNPSVRRMLIEEKEVMASLEGCDWFVQLEASWHDTNNIYLAMMYYPTDLESELIRCERFSEDRARFYMIEVIIALEELHKRGIVHRDVKAANILVRVDGHIVLADFGLAKDFGRTPTVAERSYQPYWPFTTDDNVFEAQRRSPAELTFVCKDWCGSEMEMAPEIIHQSYYSFGVDYWSSGITLYAMVTGRHPWSDEEDIPTQIIQNNVEFYPEDEISEECKDFVWQLLKKDPAERLRIGLDMTSHPFFAGVDWEAMRNRTVSPPWIPDFVKGHFFFDDWGTIEHPEPGCALDKDEDDILPGFVYVSPNLLYGMPDDSANLQQNIPEEPFSHLFEYEPENDVCDEAFCNYEFDEAGEDARLLHSINLRCFAGAAPRPVVQRSQPVIYSKPEFVAEPPFRAKPVTVNEVQCPQTVVRSALGAIVEGARTESSVRCLQGAICNTTDITDHKEASPKLTPSKVMDERTVSKLLRFATLPSVGPVVPFKRPALFQPVLEPLVECIEATIEPIFLTSTDLVMPPNQQIGRGSRVLSLYSQVKSSCSIVLRGRDDMSFWEGVKWKVKNIWVPKVKHIQCLLRR